MAINKTKSTRTSIGNSLAATSLINPGEIILYDPSPFLAIPEKHSLDKVCSHCLLSPSNLKKCARCRVIHYCSPSCQETAWKSTHKLECTIYKHLQPRILPTELRAVLQILLRHRVDGGDEIVWKDLVAHKQELQRDESKWEDYVLKARAVVEYGKLPKEYAALALDLMCRMAVNAFRINLSDETPIGLCFDPRLALANHSCLPNAFISFEGRQVYLRALDTIKEGEQIFISYIDMVQTRDTRQEQLRARYFFTCTCSKCRYDQSPYETFLNHNYESPSKSDLLFDVKGCACIAIARARSHSHWPSTPNDIPRQDPQNNSKYLDALRKQSQILLTSKAYAVQPVPTFLDELYLHYLRLPIPDHATALSFLIFKLLNSDIYNYPQPHHPTRVIALYTIALLLKSLIDPGLPNSSSKHSGLPISVIENIDLVSAYQAVMILVMEYIGRSHGEESTIARQVEEELREVQKVQRQRGAVGELLKQWQVDGDSCVEGVKIARKLLDDLKKLGECAVIVLKRDES